jgi:hypothetical protein
MKSAVGLSMLLLFGACATEPTQEQQLAEAKMVCEMETPTGSRMPVKRCWVREDDHAQTVRAPGDRLPRSGPVVQPSVKRQ